MKILIFAFGILAGISCKGQDIMGKSFFWSLWNNDELRQNMPNQNWSSLGHLGLLPDENGFYTIGDMMLSKKQTLEYFGLQTNKSKFLGGRSGHWNEDYRWPNGIMPYQFSNEFPFSKEDRTLVLDSINEFNHEMEGCLKIV